jgi:hypothetical protein
MDLAEQQRTLFKLINGKPLDGPLDDIYLEGLRGSAYLELAQEVVQWWKSYRIERFCPLTSELLKQLKLFDKETFEFEPKGVNHHYIENVGMAFLSHMSHNLSPLIASVAQFEYALIKTKKGSDTDYIVHWNRDPVPIINALIMQVPLVESNYKENYKIHISRHLKEGFEVLKE